MTYMLGVTSGMGLAIVILTIVDAWAERDRK